MLNLLKLVSVHTKTCGGTGSPVCPCFWVSHAESPLYTWTQASALANMAKSEQDCFWVRESRRESRKKGNGSTYQIMGLLQAHLLTSYSFIVYFLTFLKDILICNRSYLLSSNRETMWLWKKKSSLGKHIDRSEACEECQSIVSWYDMYCPYAPSMRPCS